MGLLSWVRNFALSKGYYAEDDRNHYDPEQDYEDDGYDDDGYDDEEPVERISRPGRTETSSALEDDGRTPFSVIYNRKASGREPYVPSSRAPMGTVSAKVLPFSQAAGNQTIYISFPKSIDECCDISDYVRAGNSVVVNLEGIESETTHAQRVVDFLAGVVHSLDGDIQRVANRVFVLVPRDVGIAGEMKDDIKSAISIIPPIKAASFR